MAKFKRDGGDNSAADPTAGQPSDPDALPVSDQPPEPQPDPADGKPDDAPKPADDKPADAAPEEPTLADVKAGKGGKQASIKDQITNLGRQIAETAIARLGNSVQLPPDAIDLFARVSEKIAYCQIASIGADAETMESLRWQLDASLQALDNLRLSAAVAARSAVLSAAQEILPLAIQGALQIAATALAGPLGGAIVGAAGNAVRGQR